VSALWTPRNRLCHGQPRIQAAYTRDDSGNYRLPNTPGTGTSVDTLRIETQAKWIPIASRDILNLKRKSERDPLQRWGRLFDGFNGEGLCMEIWEHRKTGKGFIYIEDTGLDEALFVTPLAEIKPLKKSMAKEQPTEDKDKVTEAQKKVYQEYKKRRRQDEEERRRIQAEMALKVLDEACLEWFGRRFFELTDENKQELSRRLLVGAKLAAAKMKRNSEKNKP
jgi:hypothetical protein